MTEQNTALIEKIADLCHDQWADWAATYMSETNEGKEDLGIEARDETKVVSTLETLIFPWVGKIANLLFQNTQKEINITALIDLEYSFFHHWIAYQSANSTPENVERWKNQINTDYADLTESEKDSDRKFAREILELIL